MHPEVAHDLECLGSVLMESGDTEGAELSLRRCEEIRRVHMSPEHPEWKNLHLLLAQCLAQQGKHSEAAAMWKLLIVAVTRNPQLDSTEAQQELIAFHERRAESLEASGEYKTAAGEITTAIETLKRWGDADPQQIEELNHELTRLRKVQSTVVSKKSGSVPKKKVAKKAK